MHEVYILSRRGWLPTPYLAKTRWEAIMLAIASGIVVRGSSVKRPKVTL
jgi:hypothetical protein